MKKEWTPSDIDTLRRYYPALGCEAVAAKLGRTVRATYIKAHHLGLKKTHYGTLWTPKMLKLLTDFFPIMFNKPLAKWIGVSERTMLRKARALGLEKRPGFLKDRREDIQKLASEALKRSPNTRTRFQKGHRYSPATEFKPGHRLTPEQEAKRIASLRASWKFRKQSEELRKHGIKIATT